jgi:hypothetical protein
MLLVNVLEVPYLAFSTHAVMKADAIFSSVYYEGTLLGNNLFFHLYMRFQWRHFQLISHLTTSTHALQAVIFGCGQSLKKGTLLVKRVTLSSLS